MILYHGGARGFRPGDVIEPHDTKMTDGCPICVAGLDANHLPDRVFSTPVRLYAKHYASKWGHGTLYIVEPVGDSERSDADSLETYAAAAVTVLSVSETQVELTWSERRRLYRMWGEADTVKGFVFDSLNDLRVKRLLGIAS